MLRDALERLSGQTINLTVGTAILANLVPVVEWEYKDYVFKNHSNPRQTVYK
jgi:hypothetical protein